MLTSLEEFGSQTARAAARAAALPADTILCTSAFLLLGIALFFLITRLKLFPLRQNFRNDRDFEIERAAE